MTVLIERISLKGANKIKIQSLKEKCLTSNLIKTKMRVVPMFHNVPKQSKTTTKATPTTQISRVFDLTECHQLLQLCTSVR